MVGRSSWKSAYMPRYMGWFLLSHGFNAVFYMLTFGSSVFVLWLADLGLSKDRIGFMLSLFPYCGLIAPFITSAVTRFGLKRTYMVFYGARKFVILLMLAAPWILQRFGAAVLFAYVAGVIFVFAMCRAIAETAYYPWSREFVPDAVRGRVAGMSNVVVSLTSAVAMLLASAVLARGQGYGRYQFLIVVASTLGVISVVAMLAVPKESPGSEGSSREAWTSMRQALRDRRFRGFLLSIAASVLAVAGYPFIPLFARERLLVPDARVVLFDVAGTLGALVSSLYWGWAADRYGGKPLTLATLGVVGVLPWVWLILPPGGAVALVGGLILASCYGAVSIGLNIGSFRWFLNGIVPMERRTAYTSIWYATSGLAGGTAPFVAGWLLRGLAGLDWRLGSLKVHAFTVLFGLTTAMAVLAAFLSHRVPGETDAGLRDYLRGLIVHDLPGALGRTLRPLRRRERF